MHKGEDGTEETPQKTEKRKEEYNALAPAHL
jgi:hypothetical protein